MERSSFLIAAAASAGGAVLGWGAPAAALVFARATTLNDLLADLPRPQAGQWVRLIMGSGVAYQKQIGLGTEADQSGNYRFVETQIGMPGGSCNPNTMKRVYLRAPHFDALLAQAAVLANVANSGTILTRWGDRGGGQTQTVADARLRLVDSAYLYDDRPLRVVSRSSAVMQVPLAHAYRGSSDAGPGERRLLRTTHVVAVGASPGSTQHPLTRVELWLTPEVPFGIVKFRALARGRDPFELALYSYGTGFHSELNMSLGTIRAMTPDGTHVETG